MAVIPSWLAFTKETHRSSVPVFNPDGIICRVELDDPSPVSDFPLRVVLEGEPREGTIGKYYKWILSDLRPLFGKRTPLNQVAGRARKNGLVRRRRGNSSN